MPSRSASAGTLRARIAAMESNTTLAREVAEAEHLVSALSLMPADCRITRGLSKKYANQLAEARERQREHSERLEGYKRELAEILREPFEFEVNGHRNGKATPLKGYFKPVLVDFCQHCHSQNGKYRDEDGQRRCIACNRGEQAAVGVMSVGITGLGVAYAVGKVLMYSLAGFV